jgi:hypothetical protein
MITEDLTNQTVSAGTNVEFKISATGTAPLSYQWQKDGMALGGETAANLSLANTTTNEAGAYSVVISNRAGSVTSAVAILTVIGAPQPVHGIYTGTFVGATNGGFAAMVRSNRAAIVLGYSGPQAEGIFATNFVVAADSTFATATAQGGFVSGAFAGINISGTFTNAIGDSGTFSGARKPDTGIHASNAGYYRGTYSGAFSGNAFAILAADGSIFIFVDGVEAGGFGTVTAARDLSATAGPFGLTGTLNVTTKTLSGSYRYLGNTLGTFSLSRVLAP